MWNKDIRSATRDKCFEAVAAQINALGVRAKVQQGIVPDGAKDVAGMMVGLPDFNLTKSGIKILPGAICEHLTSCWRNVLTKGDFQTPLSEFLRHGAAGASGTVAEPCAIQAKFPLPSLQLHYARGCSLAEAFYQSISGPYQILIVGDPLCQPWAMVSENRGGRNQGRPASLRATDDHAVRRHSQAVAPSACFELFIDGRMVARSTPGNTFAIDSTKLDDGYHELRIVGIDVRRQ